MGDNFEKVKNNIDMKKNLPISTKVSLQLEIYFFISLDLIDCKILCMVKTVDLSCICIQINPSVVFCKHTKIKTM